MRLPIISGLIDRRILASFRVEPDVLARLLPQPFRPKLVRGFGIAGICLIRLNRIRPRFWPSFLGIPSENAAHRIAVEWDEDGEVREGVYIPRRDTSSWLIALAGGRLFPGVHQRARFNTEEGDGSYRVEVAGAGVQIAVQGRATHNWPADSVFQSLEEASDFFARGSLGYSPSTRDGVFDGLELCTREWRVEQLDIQRIESSFFEDTRLFPRGTVEFDCALLMRNVRHEWQERGTMACHAPEILTPSPAASPATARVRPTPARRASVC